MPYKSEKIKIEGTQYDKRVKLSPEQRAEIIEAGAGYGINKLAREYNVSKRLIQFILYPERIKAMRVNRDWRKYADREKLTIATRGLRQKKQKLFLEGKISLK